MPDFLTDSGRNFKVVKSLENKDFVQETHHRVTEDSGILCQEAIELA
jgi:hypothetical protein